MLLIYWAVPHLSSSIFPLPSIDRHSQINHARELFGPVYRLSLVRHGEQLEGVESFLFQEVQRQLPEQWHAQSYAIASTIIDQANLHRLDPLFVMALIQRESGFNPGALGSAGEIGLMQIKPETAQWIASKEGQRWRGAASLAEPCENIRLGLLYLSHLRRRYDYHSQFYLSAYNLGPTKLQQLVDETSLPTTYVRAVMERYVRLYGLLHSKYQVARNDD